MAFFGLSFCVFISHIIHNLEVGGGGEEKEIF